MNRKKTGNKIFNAFSNAQHELDKQLINREHRLRCLDIAIAVYRNDATNPETIIEAANKFYQFIRKSEENSEPTKGN